MIDQMLPRDLDDLYGPGAENADDGIDEYLTPIEELANQIGDWFRAGDIGPCDVKNCIDVATKFAEVRKGRAVDTWYFCAEHFREYLHLAEEIREKPDSRAPDLLEACKAMLSDYESQFGLNYCECDSSVGLTCNACRCRAAIAKAE